MSSNICELDLNTLAKCSAQNAPHFARVFLTPSALLSPFTIIEDIHSRFLFVSHSMDADEESDPITCDDCRNWLL